MNIFEGSRRVALLAGGIAIAGTLIALSTYTPYVPISYSISHPKGSFQRMTESCPTESGRHYFTTTSGSGARVSINLCLLTMPFGDDKRQLVPYRLDEKNILWGAAVYSREVSNYERELEARFALPQADIDWIEKEISTQYWKNWKEGIGYLGLGLGVFAGFVWAVGWIVRGFMGIPRGMDRKPSNSA